MAKINYFCFRKKVFKTTKNTSFGLETNIIIARPVGIVNDKFGGDAMIG